MTGAFHGVELVTLLFIAVIALAMLARRLGVPYPILLVVGGLFLGFVPGLPAVQLDPDLVFFVFLPPILWAAAYFTSFRDFRANLRPIALLAVGLVLATTAVVAVVAHAAAPAMGWAGAVALGAIVSPPDAVAAAAIFRRMRIPRRVVVVLEGESLVNDATALVIYRAAVMAMVTGAFGLGDAAGQFVIAGAGGVLIGLGVGGLAAAVLRWTRDALTAIAITLLAPYVAWSVAERAGVSAVLATVAGGLLLRRCFSLVSSPATRLQARAVWDLLVFALNGAVFILIGLELRTLHEALAPGELSRVAVLGLAVGAAAILTRLVWVPEATALPRLLPSVRARDPMPPFGSVLVVAWAGMRGIVSLAAALALPYVDAAGQPLPLRHAIILVTFVVILLTLVVQGLSLGPLIRRLDLPEDHTLEREAARAQALSSRAALARLEQLFASPPADPDARDRLGALRRYYEQRAAAADAALAGVPPSSSLSEAAFKRARFETLAAERRALIKARDQGVIGDEVLLDLERELDLEATRLGLANARLDEPSDDG
jgi:CPA1 family monovalent cation:H+ antiporter